MAPEIPFLLCVFFCSNNELYNIYIYLNFSCRNVAEESFADLYKVEGLRGIYIASKVVTKPSGVNIGPEHLMSYISFDHGNTWGPINPPKQDDEGQPINCALVDDCSLHLSQKFSQLYPVTR